MDGRQRKSCGETRSCHAHYFDAAHLSHSLSSGALDEKATLPVGMETL
jgi:hypothetical protein